MADFYIKTELFAWKIPNSNYALQNSWEHLQKKFQDFFPILEFPELKRVPEFLPKSRQLTSKIHNFYNTTPKFMKFDQKLPIDVEKLH